MQHNHFRAKFAKNTFICLFALIFCGACASDGTINAQAEYEQATPRPSSELIVPPGLISPDVNSNYKMLYLSPEQNTYQLDKVTNMHIMQGGSERWLVIKNKNVNQVFPTMIAYLKQQGVHIKYQNQSIGLIQTDWFDKNNVAKTSTVHQFFEWIGLSHGMNALPSLYTFRVNLWQNKNDTQIFVTDYQMNVVPTDVIPASKQDIKTESGVASKTWMSVPPNPQLELDFLMQFMAFVKLGPDEIKPNTITLENVATLPSTEPKVARDKLNGSTLILNDSFDRAWWRTGLALERVGLGVADKNRSLGEFYVYPLQDDVDNPDPSTFSRWFGDDKTNVQLPKAKYKIKLVSTGTQTTLTVEPYTGTMDADFVKSQQKYLTDLTTQLK